MSSVLNNEVELRKAVKKSLSKAQVLRQMGLQPLGGNYKQLDKYIKIFNINISHFTGQAWNIGEHFRPIPNSRKKDLKDILKKDVYYNSYKLKKRLISEGLKKEQILDIVKN